VNGSGSGSSRTAPSASTKASARSARWMWSMSTVSSARVGRDPVVRGLAPFDTCLGAPCGPSSSRRALSGGARRLRAYVTPQRPSSLRWHYRAPLRLVPAADGDRRPSRSSCCPAYGSHTFCVASSYTHSRPARQVTSSYHCNGLDQGLVARMAEIDEHLELRSCAECPVPLIGSLEPGGRSTNAASDGEKERNERALNCSF
jgi:hypothetical protein